MMRAKKLLIVAVLVALASFGHSLARADFYVVIGDGTDYVFNAGDNGVTLPIYGYNTAGTAITITNFDLAFDVSGNPDGYDGAGIPGSPDYFDNFGGIPVSGTDFVDSNPFPVGSPGHDVIYSGSPSPGINLPAFGTLGSTVLLGTFTFDISASTPTGSYGFKFVPNATFDGSTLVNTATTDPDFQVATGSFRNQFTVVPEPSSLMLSTLVIAGLGFYRRRSRSL